jgi:hypothetical protein
MHLSYQESLGPTFPGRNCRVRCARRYSAPMSVLTPSSLIGTLLAAQARHLRATESDSSDQAHQRHPNELSVMVRAHLWLEYARSLAQSKSNRRDLIGRNLHAVPSDSRSQRTAASGQLRGQLLVHRPRPTKHLAPSGRPCAAGSVALVTQDHRGGLV